MYIVYIGNFICKTTACFDSNGLSLVNTFIHVNITVLGIKIWGPILKRLPVTLKRTFFVNFSLFNSPNLALPFFSLCKPGTSSWRWVIWCLLIHITCHPTDTQYRKYTYTRSWVRTRALEGKRTFHIFHSMNIRAGKTVSLKEVKKRIGRTAFSVYSYRSALRCLALATLMAEWRNQCLFTRSVTDPKISSADFLGAWEGNM